MDLGSGPKPFSQNGSVPKNRPATSGPDPTRPVANTNTAGLSTFVQDSCL